MRGLQTDFSPECLAELARIDSPAKAKGEPHIRDLRKPLWASIDNDDSEDLDQLTVAEPLDDGKARIRVAVADVDSLVHKDSAIDRDAQANTTSVYTAAQIFPMLPLKLSTNLTSLNLNQDRLAVVVDMNVAPDGSLVDSDVYRAVVHNHAKLAYNSVAAWLEGCEDRDRAQALAGATVAVRRAELPDPGEGEHYWADLIGLTVVSAAGQELGRVAGLMATGANDVLVVQGERERLIPFLPGSVVQEVDLAARRVRVDWDPDF